MVEIMEEKIRHLEMIQNVIHRMASNSFTLKGWTVTLIGIIGAITLKTADEKAFALLFIPLIAFWFLDAYYLKLERSYRVLYNKIVSGILEPNFSMDITEITETDYCNCLFSVTELFFYLPLGILLIIIKSCI